MNKNIPKLRFNEFNDEWQTKKLGEVFTFRPTNSFSRENLNYNEGKVKNIHYGDIHTKFKTLFNIKLELVPFINEEINIDRISSDNYCKVGDLILADASEDLNDVGKSIEICDLNNEKLLAGLHTILARPNENIFKIGFTGLLFKSNNIRLNIQKESQGSKVLSISPIRLSKIPISFPTLPEQEKIADFLMVVDKKLEKMKEKKQYWEQYKKGIMQKIFSQEIRFKDNKGNNYPDWEEKRISDIFEITRGYVLSMNELKSEVIGDFKYPVYSSQTKENGLAGYYNQYLFQDCITWTTDGAGAGDVNFRKGKFFCTNVCGVLINKNGFANTFIAEKLNSVTKKYVSYVGNPKLMNNIMAKIEILIPISVEEQTKIADFLSSIDDKIEQINSEILEISNWKKGLLQQMFV